RVEDVLPVLDLVEELLDIAAARQLEPVALGRGDVDGPRDRLDLEGEDAFQSRAGHLGRDIAQDGPVEERVVHQVERRLRGGDRALVFLVGRLGPGGRSGRRGRQEPEQRGEPPRPGAESADVRIWTRIHCDSSTRFASTVRASVSSASSGKSSGIDENAWTTV